MDRDTVWHTLVLVATIIVITVCYIECKPLLDKNRSIFKSESYVNNIQTKARVDPYLYSDEFARANHILPESGLGKQDLHASLFQDPIKTKTRNVLF